MNLEEAKTFTASMLASGHKSDGCTLVKDFIFTPACQIHDFLIRFSVVSRKEADDLFLEYMLELAKEHIGFKLLAYTRYIAMRYVAKIFRGNFTLALGLHGFGAVMLALYFISK